LPYAAASSVNVGRIFGNIVPVLENNTHKFVVHPMVMCK
jgi:hypothetical protein